MLLGTHSKHRQPSSISITATRSLHNTKGTVFLRLCAQTTNKCTLPFFQYFRYWLYNSKCTIFLRVSAQNPNKRTLPFFWNMLKRASQCTSFSGLLNLPVEVFPCLSPTGVLIWRNMVAVCYMRQEYCQLVGEPDKPLDLSFSYLSKDRGEVRLLGGCVQLVRRIW